MSDKPQTTTVAEEYSEMWIKGWNAAIAAAENIAQESAIYHGEDGGEIYIAAKIAKEVGKLRKP